MAKLFYSITELCDALNEEPYRMRDALAAAGVPVIHEGQPADLSRWWSGVINHPNGTQVIIHGNHCTNPSPDEVMVLFDRLPDSWRRKLGDAPEEKNTLAGNETCAEDEDSARAALERNHGNKTHAARELGISTKTLRRRLGIDGTGTHSTSSAGSAHNPFGAAGGRKH